MTPLGDDARAKPSRRAARDPTVEDELDVVRSAEIQIVANHLFEEGSARRGPVEDLRQRELGLENGHGIAIIRAAVGRGEGMGQPPKPSAGKGVNLGRRQAVADPLEAARLGA